MPQLQAGEAGDVRAVVGEGAAQEDGILAAAQGHVCDRVAAGVQQVGGGLEGAVLEAGAGSVEELIAALG